ncbi:MAG TPA: hypothetical protein VHD76_20150 [Bryobacteraceae bacterium]|nr:hypothetical protein [Bryobacteraceae bacterium]
MPAEHPATPGETIILYGTGFGPVSPAVLTGTPAPLSPLSFALITPDMKIGGIQSQVRFAGLAPQFTGLYQLNVVIPRQAASGEATIAVSAGGNAARPVTIPIE